jgi:hypothetical protein
LNFPQKHEADIRPREERKQIVTEKWVATDMAADTAAIITIDPDGHPLPDNQCQ